MTTRSLLPMLVLLAACGGAEFASSADALVVHDDAALHPESASDAGVEADAPPDALAEATDAMPTADAAVFDGDADANAHEDAIGKPDAAPDAPVTCVTATCASVCEQTSCESLDTCRCGYRAADECVTVCAQLGASATSYLVTGKGLYCDCHWPLP